MTPERTWTSPHTPHHVNKHSSEDNTIEPSCWFNHSTIPYTICILKLPTSLFSFPFLPFFPFLSFFFHFFFFFFFSFLTSCLYWPHLLELAHSSASLYLFWSHILSDIGQPNCTTEPKNGHCVQHNDLGL